MATAVQTERPDLDTTSGESVAHIVTKHDQMMGYIEGAEVTALCGKKFVPSRDPQNLPRCEPCLLSYQARMGGAWN